MDKNKTMNTEFNEVYEAISNAYNAISEFYMKHYLLIDQTDVDDRYARYGTKDILEQMGDCKELAHDIAEHFTWDK